MREKLNDLIKQVPVDINSPKSVRYICKYLISQPVYVLENPLLKKLVSLSKSFREIDVVFYLFAVKFPSFFSLVL
jgi:hypothetical protein